MNELNTIGVDLAKNIIQISVVSSSNKERLNKAFSRKKFSEFLSKQTPSLVAFEACASAHYWGRVAMRCGHEIKIIPAKAIVPFRQGHKTDKNYALAIAEAANRPNIKAAPHKGIEQQAMQSVQRSRDHLVSERTALSNHLRGLLLEFGIAIPQGFTALTQSIPEILEDGENELSDIYRPTLARLYERFCQLQDDIVFMDNQITCLIKANESCKRLTQLEGVGPISSILLYSSLGSGDAFKSGREFSAYVGLTPKQFSSGGKINIVGISKHVANRKLRAVLIQGARAYVHKLKEPKTTKDKWLMALIERAGCGRAAVALANKNVRTAWALLTTGEDYQKYPIVMMQTP
jgi:transposase